MPNSRKSYHALWHQKRKAQKNHDFSKAQTIDVELDSFRVEKKYDSNYKRNLRKKALKRQHEASHNYYTAHRGHIIARQIQHYKDRYHNDPAFRLKRHKYWEKYYSKQK